MFSRRTEWNLAPNRLSEALSQFRRQRLPLIDLSASNPTEAGFDYDRSAIVQALCHSESLKYDPNPLGLAAARDSVAEYYSRHQAKVGPEDIVLTTSTSEAYSFVFRMLCDPGDEILVPSPSYPLFDFLADIQDVKLLPYTLLYDHGWQIDFHALKSALTPRSRGIIVVHPNNPTGHFTKHGELAELNAICGSQRMALIADEVFLDFNLTAAVPFTFAANCEALTFTLSGLSKIAGLPQMKVAWIATSGPAELKAQALARLEIIADTYLSMNAPVQWATPRFLEQREPFQTQVLSRVRQNLDELDAQLMKQSVCSRLAVEGGWYAVLRIPSTRDDEDFAIEILQSRGVYVHPGHFYNFPGQGYLVVSLITPPLDFANGIRQLLMMFSDR